MKLNLERDVAPSERLEEFDGPVDYSYGATNTNVLFGQPRVPERAPRSTMYGHAGAVPDTTSSSLAKAELSELLFEHVGLNKREAKDIVDAFFDEISSALERGESVKLTGFGNFQLRDKASRPGRNPRTGLEVKIPAKRVVTFQASQKLKNLVDTFALEGQVNENPHG